MSRNCIADTTYIRLCTSSSKTVGSTVEIWYRRSTENSVWRIVVLTDSVQPPIYKSWTFSVSKFSKENIIHKRMRTSLQSTNKGRAKGAHDPSAVHMWVQNENVQI